MKSPLSRILKLGMPTLVLLLIGALALVISHPLHPSLASSSSTCQTWNLVNELDPATPNQIAAHSAKDIWIVGSMSNDSGSQTLTQHWNGKAWSVIPSPNADQSNTLDGVVALTTKNVWAVGSSGNSNNGSFVSHTLIEHWNGSVWSSISSPNPGSDHNELLKITVATAKSIWAIGDYGNSSQDNQPLIEHWDGTAWTMVAQPTIDPSDTSIALTGIVALSAKSVWVVGTHGNANGQQAFIEHWNGKRWKISLSAISGSPYSSLSDITRVPGTTKLWAVGTFHPANNGENNTTFILGEYWNGKQWSTTTAPQVSYNDTFATVTALSAQSVWAIGATEAGSGRHTPIMGQWNGSQWNDTNPAINNPPGGVPTFSALTHVPGTDELLAIVSIFNPSTLAQPTYLVSCGS